MLDMAPGPLAPCAVAVLAIECTARADAATDGSQRQPSHGHRRDHPERLLGRLHMARARHSSHSAKAGGCCSMLDVPPDALAAYAVAALTIECASPTQSPRRQPTTAVARSPTRSSTEAACAAADGASTPPQPLS